ncbi:MAG: hypothetical protein ACTSYI_11650 [Promethearchaeota archaeon]
MASNTHLMALLLRNSPFYVNSYSINQMFYSPFEAHYELVKAISSKNEEKN